MTNTYYEVDYFNPEKVKFIHIQNFNDQDKAEECAENLSYGCEIHTRVIKHIVELICEYEV